MTRELRQLDEQCALEMGWHTLPGCDALHKGDECIHDQIPNFSTGCRAARLLEDEIERRELQYAYTNALVEIVGYQPDVSPLGWACLRASPEQRARAFLEAIKP